MIEQRKQTISTFIEVDHLDSDEFLKLRETLTRLGVATYGAMAGERNSLAQQVHILHSCSRYYLVHFKQMHELDGKPVDFDEKDRARLHVIASMLESWGMVKLKTKVPAAHIGVDIIKHHQKRDWDLVSQYELGRNAAGYIAATNKL